MTLRLHWSAPARSEFDAIDERYAATDREQADKIGDALIAASVFLTEWPQAGPQMLRTDKRKWRVKDTPYILLYRPEGDVLRVLHVVHHAQNWQRFI